MNAPQQKKQEEQKPVIIAQDNSLTTARYDFELIEKRCLYVIIQAVRAKYITPDPAPPKENLWGDMIVRLQPEDLEKCSLGERNVHNVYKCLSKLQGKQLYINNDDEWTVTSWITRATHKKKENYYEVKVDGSILPYLVQLAAKYTSYDLVVAISFKSTYTQRFYELCSQFKNKTGGVFFYTVEQIREMFQLVNKYHNTAALRIKVIDVARDEMKAQFDKGDCEIYFDYWVKEKKGKEVIAWYFKVYRRSDEKNQPTDYMLAKDAIKYIRETLTQFIKRDPKFISRVTTALNLNPDMAAPIADKIRKKILDYPTREIPPILRYVLRNDFDIS
jgi:repA